LCSTFAYRRINDCEVALEGIVSKRKDSAYRSGRSPDWLKMKNPEASAVKREAEEVLLRRRANRALISEM
jgi:ATP-dependent DNA ligase